jgi:hypothetical protein
MSGKRSNIPISNGWDFFIPSSLWVSSPMPVPILCRERGATSQSAVVGIFLCHQVYEREAQGRSRSCIGKEEQHPNQQWLGFFYTIKSVGEKPKACPDFMSGKRSNIPISSGWDFFMPSSLWVKSPRPVPILHRERGATSQSAMVGMFL